MAEKHENYLFDIGSVIKDRAFDARRQREGLPQGSLERDFPAVMPASSLKRTTSKFYTPAAAKRYKHTPQGGRRRRGQRKHEV